ncbi:MAG: TetR/AcrR family transcriptional regulator [Clostridia bacterium]|nr:TetR/AcrR family transcriptional regulator [Clostridia bacterium]
MARKKEPELIHVNQEKIAAVARQLFLKKGIAETKIDEIAKTAGMSKSTLYVYFKSKEEIKNYLSLEAMNDLLLRIQAGLENKKNSLKERYLMICHTFVDYKEQYPFNFQLLVEEISVDGPVYMTDPYLESIYQTGEAINQCIIDSLLEKGEVHQKEELIRTVFTQWGSIYGVIVLADNKEAYIKKELHMTKREFLDKSFEDLFKVMGGAL